MPAGLAENGKFAPGNKLGKGGNNLAAHALKIRAMLFNAFTPERQKKVCNRLISMAEWGDIVAIKELLDRTAGKPTTSIEIDGQTSFVIAPIIRENIIIEEPK
jgi:hypothetical protein